MSSMSPLITVVVYLFNCFETATSHDSKEAYLEVVSLAGKGPCSDLYMIKKSLLRLC